MNEEYIYDDKTIKKKIIQKFIFLSPRKAYLWADVTIQRILKLVVVCDNDKSFVNELYTFQQSMKQHNVSPKEVKMMSNKVLSFLKVNHNKLTILVLQMLMAGIRAEHEKPQVLVACENAVRIVGELTENDVSSISNERQYQLQKLEELIDKK